ncbi:MAG: hypothetical protein CMJ89_09430 [Planctomycetes bacterium]|jgi:phosphopantothenoylcysteine decarboxylase/phosphopantothenate--cysteine ligase|nr:hypothetical protein [Planctomycetota bacterium]
MSPGKKRHVVVTAGPTREPIDPVRYLSNESSGRMGFEIAAAAARHGDRVTLIAGPVHLETPPGVHRVDVETALEMLREAREAFRGADALIMCAAVSDWRPKKRHRSKWRKESEGDQTTLELVKNPDILATLGKRKGDRLVIGFALETGSGLSRARAKLERKNADFIVLNDASVLGSTRTSVRILGRDGSRWDVKNRTKRQVAETLVGLEKPSLRIP